MEQINANTSKERNIGSGTAKRASRVAWIAAAVAGLTFASVRGTTAQEAPRAAMTPSTMPTHANGTSIGMIADGVDADGRINLTVNRSQVVTTKVQYKRVSIGNPDIADYNTIGPGNILITAKKPGSTQMIVWDDADRSQVIDVNVTADMNTLQDQLKAMFPETNIQVAQLNGAIALRGHVPNTETAEQAAAVASPYSPKVLNLMEVSGGKQVMLQVRFAEVSRTAVSQLGVNGNYISGGFLGGSNIGQVNPSGRLLNSGTVGTSAGINGVALDGATAVNPSVTLYGAGQIGNFYLEYFIQALRSNNLLRTLAEPNLLTISGQKAEFLAGGKFPVPVTQGGGGSGGVAVTVEYREYGVHLLFVPVILGNGKIRLKVAPEVSDLDFTTAVRFNGYVIPGITTREVDTTVELADGQTFAIAGLLNNQIQAQKDVTPLLGDLPIVGALFRSVRYQRKETELIVLVTPRLVEGLNPAQVPTMPGEKWRNPSENDLFWNRDLGGEMPDSHKAPTTGPSMMAESTDIDAPRFRGSYGFVPATQPAEAGN